MRLLSHRLTAALRLLGFSEILASSFGSRVELLPFVNNKIPELLIKSWPCLSRPELSELELAAQEAKMAPSR